MMLTNRILVWVAWSALAVLAVGPDALAQRRGSVGRSSVGSSSVGRNAAGSSSAGRSVGSSAVRSTSSIGQRSSSASIRGTSSGGRSSYGRPSSSSIGRSSIGRSSTSSSRVSPRSWSGGTTSGTDSTGSSGRPSYGYPGSNGSSTPRFLGPESRNGSSGVETRDVTPSIGESSGADRTRPGGAAGDSGSSSRGGELVVDPLIIDLGDAGMAPPVRVPRLSGTSGRPAPARARAAALEHRRSSGEAALRDGVTRTISDRPVSTGDILNRYSGATSRTGSTGPANVASGRTALADVPRLSRARSTPGARGAGAAARGDEKAGQGDAERVARIRSNQAARANADSTTADRVKNIRENQALRKVGESGSSDTDRISNIRRNQAIRDASGAGTEPANGGRDVGTGDARTAGDPNRRGDRDGRGGRNHWDRDDDGHCGYDHYDHDDHFGNCGWVYWGCGYSWYTWWYYPAWCGYRYYWWPVYLRPYYYDAYYEPYYERAAFYGDTVVYVDPGPGGVTYVDEAYDEPVSGEAVITGQVDPDLASELSRAADYYLELGDKAFQERRYGDAVHHYAKAVEFNPDEGILYLVLSDALFATGDYHYAAYALRKAFEVDPTIAGNVVDKHTFYSDPTEFDRQLAVLELYLEEHFLDDDARLVLAANYVYGGRPSEAVDLLQSAFSLEVSKTQAGRLLLAAAEGAQYGQHRGN